MKSLIGLTLTLVLMTGCTQDNTQQNLNNPPPPTQVDTTKVSDQGQHKGQVKKRITILNEYIHENARCPIYCEPVVTSLDEPRTSGGVDTEGKRFYKVTVHFDPTKPIVHNLNIIEFSKKVAELFGGEYVNQTINGYHTIEVAYRK